MNMMIDHHLGDGKGRRQVMNELLFIDQPIFFETSLCEFSSYLLNNVS